jgi:hypothetical protein
MEFIGVWGKRSEEKSAEIGAKKKENEDTGE